MNANKGVFGVNLGHMWGEVDRMRGWMDQLMSLWDQGAIKPKIARTFPFDEAAGGPSFHSGPQEHREGGVADALSLSPRLSVAKD
jgi:NADPH:quinone reductase-like Zn-dependent oxidoreductase